MLATEVVGAGVPVNTTVGALVVYFNGGFQTTNILATGTITANLFNGSGAGLTSLNSSNISSGTLTVARGGTGAGTFTAGRLLLGNGTTNITENANLTWDSTNNILIATNFSGDGSRLTNINTSNVSGGTLAVARGGTGGASFVAGQLLIGNTTSVFSQSTGLTWTTASNLLTATNLNITGNSTTTGTSILTGNVGIGTSTSVANVLQVGAGGRLRIANNNTDYTAIGSTDTDGPLNTQIVISGSSRSTNAGNIQYVATGTNGSHIFYTSSPITTRMTISSTGVNINDNLGVSGRVGYGIAPHPTYRVDVNGTLNATSVFVNGSAIIPSRWSLTPSTTNIFYNSGNVGIGTTNPVYRTHFKSTYDQVATGIHIDASDDTNPNKYALTIWPYVIGGGEVGYRFRTQNLTGGTATPLTLNNYGNVVVQNNLNTGSLNVAGEKVVGGNSLQRNTYIYSPNESASIGLYFGTPFTGSPFGASKSAIIAEPITNHSRHHLAFCMNRENNNSINVGTGGDQVYIRMHQDNYIDVFKQVRIYNELFAGFTAVNNTNTDYLCVQQNYGAIGGYNTNWIRVAFGSFTAFHRCYTDDELYNNETDQSIDLFKNNYMGRVFIATGKIKTDLSRKKETHQTKSSERLDGEPEEGIVEQEENEWYTQIDKDGISIEDAIPVVQLSRQKKDKRVFGVLGAPKRSTNNKDRLIVNSIGEGGIAVSNTNGNIENGDYIQSSDLLGYGEKQDDDLLHNYTIAKATIDCNFELDSPYYQCHEIENGVRVAFIACTYHCG